MKDPKIYCKDLIGIIREVLTEHDESIEIDLPNFEDEE